MKTSYSMAFVLLVLAGWVAADLPRKAPLTKYQNLWSNSPFTTKPVDGGGPPPPNPLDDYALSGVSPIQGGYRVTIINKKDPTERKYVYSDQPNASHGFQIISVERKEGDMRGTVVHMKSGDLAGTVTYDEKLLTIAAPQPVQPPAAAGRGRPVNGNAVATQPNQPGVNPVQGNQQVSPRPPRPRVIGPPPSPAPQPRTNNNTSGQRPVRR